MASVKVMNSGPLDKNSEVKTDHQPVDIEASMLHRIRRQASCLTKAAIDVRANAEVISSNSKYPPLFYFTDDRRNQNFDEILHALDPGTGVVFRHYNAPNRADFATKCLEICRDRNLTFFVAGDIELAIAIGADGYHAPSKDLEGSCNLANIARLPAKMSVSAACHNEDELERASKFGAGFAFLSPVFATKSHPDEPSLGVERFKQIAANAPLPIYGLGGITLRNYETISTKNVIGFGAIGAFTEFN